MLFFVCGVPKDFFGRFQSNISKVFGDGHRVIARPTAPRSDGRYCPSAAEADEAISQYCGELEANRRFAASGCGVLLLRSSGEDISSALERFRPYALPATVDLPTPTVTVGPHGSKCFREMTKSLADSLIGLRRALRTMVTEFEARRNRSPLLLPIRNFESDVLQQEINGLFDNLSNHPDPRERVGNACSRIERSHPFSKVNGKGFSDKRDVRFKMPGRALHGSKSSVGAGHQEQCLINEHLRLGGFIAQGHHFDCVYGENGRLSGEFPNCHDGVTEAVGRPHLNIYPNDFVR